MTPLLKKDSFYAAHADPVANSSGRSAVRYSWELSLQFPSLIRRSTKTFLTFFPKQLRKRSSNFWNHIFGNYT